MSLEAMEIELRRFIEAGDIPAAETLAVEIDRVKGEPVEDDRYPLPIQTWGTDA